MKKLRISFAAIIAVVAIGLTVAAQAGAFETKEVKAVTKCFRPSNNLKAKQIGQCASAEQTLAVGLACEDALAFDGGAVWSVGAIASAPFYTPTERQANCQNTNFFCCFTVVEGTLCSNPTIDLGDVAPAKYIIQDVFCRNLAQ